MEGGIHMTDKEASRAKILVEVSRNELSQTKAAELLGLSLRQLQRLYTAFLIEGVTAVVSRRRGKPSNHQLPQLTKARILELVTNKLYAGFGPTFMCEKLEELHGITVCPETTRQLMIESGVWQAHKKKRPVIHQQRKRRARFGELLQIDGSPHTWFEDRDDPCVLIVFIDDATGQTYGKFFPVETTRAYMTVAYEYLMEYGRPLAFYSDKHSIFRVNRPGCTKKECITQFARALQELEIELICANSPQAKGRVERVNGTLQDRLVKEMRIAGVSNIEEGNQFLESYWKIHNRRFKIDPEDSRNAHRKILPEQDLSKIFSIKEYRKVSKNLEVQYNNVIYQILQKSPLRSLCRARVSIIESLNGKITMEYKGRQLPFREYGKQEYAGKEVDPKEVDRFLKDAKSRRVSYNHPWNQEGRATQKRHRYIRGDI
jgi:hypothetical protein